MTNGRPHWTFGPIPSGRRPPETGSQLRLLQRHAEHVVVQCYLLVSYGIYPIFFFLNKNLYLHFDIFNYGSLSKISLGPWARN